MTLTSHTIATLRPLAVLALTAAVAPGCASYAGGTGGGGGGYITVGGAPDSFCNPDVHNQGCSIATKVQCDPATKKWQAIGDCAAGQICRGKSDPTDPQKVKQLAECVVPGGATDAGGADTGGTTTDTGVTDTGVTDTGVTDTGITDTGATGPLCGDGKCEAGESNATCPQDCKQANLCGNGACDAGEQTSCPKDCPTGPVCGNGTCESGESTNTCPQDCAPKDVCGDLKCSGAESSTSCGFDCSKVAAQLGGCLGSKCSAQLSACQKDTSCVTEVGKSLNCAESCPQLDSACLSQCSSNLSNLPAGFNLVVCAGNQGCVPQGPVCGDGKCESGETASSCAKDCGGGGNCGDGKCSKGETWNSCAKDCGGTGTFGPKACWDTGCVKETSACKAHHVCAGQMGCLKNDLDGNTCVTKHGWTQAELDSMGKLYEDLASCAYKACADPNGAKCSQPGKDGAKNRCGQFDNSWPCNCDDDCANFGDCCSDYNATCKSP